MFTLDRLETRQFLSAVLVDGTLTITGTDAGETIYVEGAGAGRIRAAIDSTSLGLFKPEQVRRIVIDGKGGADFIHVNRLLTDHPLTLIGGAGNDSIYGNDAPNFIHGGPGDDQSWGLRGRDTLIGGSGNDLLNGGPDRDVLNGSVGHDTAVIEGKDSVHQVESRGPARWYEPVPGMSLPYEFRVEQQGDLAAAILDVTFNDGGWNLDVSSARRSGRQINIILKLSRAAGDMGVTNAVIERRYTVPLGNLASGAYTVNIMTIDGQFHDSRRLNV